MTTTTPSELHRKALEAAATALMREDVCGLNFAGERLLCDDPRVSGEYRQVNCSCRASATVAITAYQAAIGAEPVACPIAAGLKEIIKAGTSTDEFEQWEVFSKEAQIAKAMLASLTALKTAKPVEKPDLAELPGDFLKRVGMDGHLWAGEFRKMAVHLGYSDMDEGWLIGWFCNAIMAGWDEAKLRAERTASASADTGRAAWPVGTSVRVEHDGFAGTVIGHYRRLDGYEGTVVQQDGTKVVHVYGIRHLLAALSPPTDRSGE